MTDLTQQAIDLLRSVTGCDEWEVAAAIKAPLDPDNLVTVPEALRAIEAALRTPDAGGRDGYLEQHHRDSTELRRLCGERDAHRDTANRLRHAGSLLSNIAYNLAQDDKLPETTRWSLDDARKKWDAASAQREVS